MKTLQRLTQLLLIFLFSFIFTTISNAQCDFSNLSVEESDCNDAGVVDLVINFEFTGEGNQGFTILGNGTNYGNFEYASLPVTLSGIEANCETEYEFIIRDIQDPTCSVFTEYGIICCSGACNLEILGASTSVCVDEIFSLTVETSLSSAGTLVNVSINGIVISQIELDGMPFILEDITVDQPGVNTITICAASDVDCCSSFPFLNPCECATSNITAEIIDCNEIDSSYFAIIDFDYAATSDSFQMGYSDGNDNNFLGIFAYVDLPVTAGPIFWSDNEREILIVDKGDFFCFNSAFLGVVNDCDIACQIFNVFAESYECESGQYFMDVEFDTEDIQGSSFEVIVDDINYGTFIYGESFYTVGPINQNCDSAPVVVIQDSDMESCKDFFNFDEPICCGVLCEFTTFEASSICNDADEVVISFEYNNPSTTPNNQFFVTFGDMLYGPFAGPSGTGEFSVPLLADGVYNLLIYVDGNEACSAETSVVVLCPMEECLITEVFAEAHDCIDGQFLVDVAFDASGVSDNFELRGNGQSYGVFGYGQTFYTIGPLQGDCETIYEFVIIDQADTNCQGSYAFDGPICCQTCEYGEMEIVLIDCEEDQYTISIDFEFEDSGETFELSFLGETFTYEYTQLPLEINNLPVNTEIEITAISNSDEECTTSGDSFLQNCYDAVTEDEINSFVITQDQAIISTFNATTKEFEIFLSSITGEVLERDIMQASAHVNFQKSTLSNGLYLISLVHEGVIYSKKIVITDRNN
ncbi:MAG: hypothetical protein ACJA1A_003703 [Saprospiraceae bacterium]|jgi:hypothetical protein